MIISFQGPSSDSCQSVSLDDLGTVSEFGRDLTYHWWNKISITSHKLLLLPMNWCRTSSISMIHWESRVQLLHCCTVIFPLIERQRHSQQQPCQQSHVNGFFKSSRCEKLTHFSFSGWAGEIYRQCTWWDVATNQCHLITQGRVAESPSIPPVCHRLWVRWVVWLL